MRALSLRTTVATAVIATAVLAMTQIGLPAAQATAASQTRGVPGPSAVGKRVDTRQLPPIKGDTPQQVRQIPRLYPVDASAFGQMKAAANEAAAAQAHRPGSGSSTSSTTGIDTLNFTQTGGWNPPDAGFAVGPSSILVALNEAYAIYDKTSGALLQGPISFGTLFGTSDSVFDPRAIYDNGSGRFVISTTSQNTSTNSSNFMLAVSQDEDPQTSGWCTYEIDAVTGSGSSAAWADFPGLGMDGNNLYITSNQFGFSGNGFQFARVLTIPKASAYPTSTGGCPTETSTDYQGLLNPDGSTAFAVQPANQFGAAPGSTTPMYFVNALWSSGSQLVVRSTNDLGLPHSVIVAPYTMPADAPQPGHGAKPIDTGDDRLLGAVFANNTIYTSNTTGSVSSRLSSSPNPYANAQWYAINVGSDIATSKAITNSGVAYYFPAVAPASSGAVAVEVSGSSSKQPASAFYVSGSGTPTKYAGGVSGYTLASRWGDYGAAAPDPSDGSIWVLGEYAKYTGGWGTAVAHVP